MSLLGGFRVVQLGPGMAAAVCGRMMADIGAVVGCIGADTSTPLLAYLNHGKAQVDRDALIAADLVVCEGQPEALRAKDHDATALRRLNAHQRSRRRRRP